MSAGVSYAGMAFNFEIMKNLFCLHIAVDRQYADESCIG